jgi:ketosteroid isomerase-like protein
MSEANLEIVEAAFAALHRDRVDGLASYVTEDIDWRAMKGAPDDHGPIHGKDAMRAYVEDWFEMFDDVMWKPVELVDAGANRVVAVVQLSGRAKLSGVQTDMTYSVVYTIRDGKIAAGREYATRQEALEAAGMSESAG